MPVLETSRSVVQRFPTAGRSSARPAPCWALAGGATGGHLFPGLAVAAALVEKMPRASIVFAGPGRDWERRCVEQAGFDYLCVPSRPLPCSPIPLCHGLYANVAGYRRMVGWLARRDVHGVIGLGGYSSVPAVLAARRRAIPTFLLEQNIVPGKATRWLARGAEAVFTAFEETRERLSSQARTRCTGNPVRPEIARRCSKPVRPRAGRRTLLVTGGSQGAQSLNRAVLAALSQLREVRQGWQIIHQTGHGDHAAAVSQYEQQGLSAIVQPFFAEMAPLYEQADLVVCRAGATTLSELACAGLPAVVLPYRHAAADHQTANARWYERRGGVVSVRDQHDARQTIADLTQELRTLMTDVHRLRHRGERMQQLALPEAASDVAAQVMAIARVLT